MQHDQKPFFTSETLAQIPIFFRYLTGGETASVEEFRLGTRYSKCEQYFSNNYMRFEYYKPAMTLPVNEQNLSEETNRHDE